jgi:hypothetical protein
MITPRRLLLAGAIDELLLAHRGQEPQQLRWLLNLVLAQRRAHEEAGEDRLADVHRIEQPPEAGINQSDAGFAADRRLVEAADFSRRFLIARSYTPDKITELALFGYLSTPAGLSTHPLFIILRAPRLYHVLRTATSPAGQVTASWFNIVESFENFDLCASFPNYLFS